MSSSQVRDNDCVESRPIYRSINNLSALTEGADGAYLGVTTPNLSEGNTNDALPDLDAVSAFVAAIDFDNVTTSVQNNLNPPDQNVAGQTDHGFVDFYTMVTDPVQLSLSFVGEGVIFILVDEGDGFQEVARQAGPFSHLGTGENSGNVTHTLVNAGLTRVRFVQIDIEGTSNLWVYDGDPITTFAPSSGAPSIENRDLLLDCDGNYFELDGTPVAGTVLPPQVSEPNEGDDSSPPQVIAGLTQTREIANASVDNQNVNDNDVIDVTTQLVEGNWAATAEGFVYNGSPSYTVINAATKQTNGSGAQRPAPILSLQTRVGTDAWVTVSTSATGYIRNASGHNESSNQIFYRHLNPPANSEYRLTSGIEAIAGVVNSNFGQFDLEAVTNI